MKRQTDTQHGAATTSLASKEGTEQTGTPDSSYSTNRGTENADTADTPPRTREKLAHDLQEDAAHTTATLRPSLSVEDPGPGGGAEDTDEHHCYRKRGGDVTTRHTADNMLPIDRVHQNDNHGSARQTTIAANDRSVTSNDSRYSYRLITPHDHDRSTSLCKWMQPPSAAPHSHAQILLRQLY
eukprot:gene12252-25748_t